MVLGPAGEPPPSVEGGGTGMGIIGGAGEPPLSRCSAWSSATTGMVDGPR